MASVFTIEDQIQESRRTRLYGEFPSGLLSIPSEREQVVMLPDSLSEEQQRGAINLDIPSITWELMSPTHIPETVVFEPPTLRISHQDILDAKETDFLDDLLSEYTGEEREQIRLGLSSWVAEKLQESGLELTEVAKATWVNLIALIMKKVSKMLQDSEG